MEDAPLGLLVCYPFFWQELQSTSVIVVGISRMKKTKAEASSMVLQSTKKVKTTQRGIMDVSCTSRLLI